MAALTLPRSPGAVSVQVDEDALDAIFAPYNQGHLPGVSVGVALRGRPVYRKGFGLANIEQPLPLASHTRMRIASVSKHFTSLAYLRLCDAGEAALNARLGSFLPELDAEAGEARMDHLMGHVSGLRDAEEIHNQLMGAAAATPITEILDLYRHSEVRFAAPGSTWQYGNGGYLLLGAAIERIAGQPLGDVLRELVFAPAGLHDTFLRPWETDFVANSAAMHMTAVDGGFAKTYLTHELGGDGGLVSTVDDLLRWLAFLDAPTFGSAETWTHLTAPLTLTNGVCTGYALGLMIGAYRGLATISHSGGLMGAKAIVLKAPAAALDVVVLSNRHDASAVPLAHKVLEACVPNLDPGTTDPSRTSGRGVFRSPSSGRVIQLQDRGGRQLVSIDGLDAIMRAMGTNELHHFDAVAHLKQKVVLEGDTAAPEALVFENFGEVDRLAPLPPGGPGLEAYAGTYACATARAVATIWVDGRLTTSGPSGGTAYALEPLGAGVWRAISPGPMPWGGVLSFDDEGFLFSTFSTPRLRFRRSKDQPKDLP